MLLHESKDPFLSEDEQIRVKNGYIAQRHVIKWLKSRFPAGKVTYTAPSGSQNTDIIFQMKNGQKVHFEVKMAGSKITAYDASIGRGGKDEILDLVATTLPYNQKKIPFTQMIDEIRFNDPSVGFPGDPGVAKSGKIPALRITNSRALNMLRLLLKKRYISKGDNYLVVVNLETPVPTFYYISGPLFDGFHSRDFPELIAAQFDTYGWDCKSKHNLRAAIKVFLKP